MNQLPKITIITVTHNAEEFIEPTIQSVIEQNYKNLEYIIVDGKSTDNTLNILNAYTNNIDILVSEKDFGIYDAMNKGITRASGEWVMLLNAGDLLIDKDTIASLVKKLDTEIDILYGDIWIVDKGITNKQYAKAGGLNSIWSFPPCWHQGMLIRASYHKENMYDLRYKSASDYNFMIESYVNKAKFKYVNEVFCYYLRGGVSTVQQLNNRLEAVAIISKHIPFIEDIQNNFFFNDMIKIYNKENFNLKEFSRDIASITEKLDSLKQKYKNIILYGFGKTAQLIAPYLGDSLKAIVDKNATSSIYTIYKPSDIKNLNYDCILITLVGREFSVICELFFKYEVDIKKIDVLYQRDFSIDNFIHSLSNQTQNNKSIKKYEAGICTQEELESKTYREWAKYLHESVTQMHRKLWEYCFIIDSLKNKGMLQSAKKGLGFAVGTEPLASAFCSFGVNITATDLDFSEASKQGWVETNQHAKNLEALNSRKICSEETFFDLCQFENVDMNNIPEHLRDFDFIWSACALEHLGSISLGERFIYESLKCLKPGGFAVHTTEYNYSSNSETISNGPTVLFRRKDIERISRKLKSEGHEVFDMNFEGGTLVNDKFVDWPPYLNENNAHLKLVLDNYVITSIGIIIKKKM
ncbi:MAG: glycosyltransferase [Sulfurimonadaceae bacterium]|nr:glycosyltransferase [Sulfurimonadaceae bacterium]